MKIKNFLRTVPILFLLPLIGLLFSASPAQTDNYEWLRPRLEATQAFTIEVFEAMPAEDYDFKANEDQRSFAEQAYHIVYTIDYFERIFANGGNAAWEPGDENSLTKAELIAWAQEKYASINRWILEQPNNDQLTAGIISYLDHNSHHRGQMITYLRMNGISPPSYR